MPAFSLRSLRPACLVLGAGLVAYAGCSSSGSAGVSVTHPTMIEVSPDQFLGGVPCVTSGPGLKSYVATLYDMNEVASGGSPSDVEDVEQFLDAETTASAFARLRGETPSGNFELPSSAPAPCNASVGFGYVVPGRRYEVLIEGYEEAREDVVARALGSHLLVSEANATGPTLKSTFRSYCRRAIPVNATVVVADQCGDDDGAGGSGGTGGAPAASASVRVPVGAVLGSFACGSEDEQVEKLKVSLTVGSVSEEQVVDCASDAEVVFEDLPAGVASVYVAALSAASPDEAGAAGASSGGAGAGGAGVGGAGPVAAPKTLAGATCDARLVADERVTARCRRLSGVGTLRVNLVAALEELGLTCSTDSVSTVNVLVGDAPPQPFPPPACLQPFEAGFAAGELDRPIYVVATPVGGGDPDTAECTATIEPGKFNLASCKSAP